MTESEWGKFFELMDKMGEPWQSKKDLTERKSDEYGSDLEEFVGWWKD